MLEKFEKKINEIKEKIDPRYLSVTMFAIFGIVTLIAMNFANVYGREKQTVEDIYNRSMYELITNVNNIDVLVTKIRVTKTNAYNLSSLSDTLAEAMDAKDNLSTLPVSQSILSNTSSYLSQVMGYSQALIKKLANGGSIDAEDKENLKSINEVSTNLNNTLSNIYEDLVNGRMHWDEVEKVASKNLSEDDASLKLGNISKITDSLQDYEGLIYDGAYSSHIENSTPKALSKKTVTVEDAATKVRKCVEMTSKNEIIIEEVKYTGNTKGKLDVYNFEVYIKDSDQIFYVDISKHDGLLVLLMSNRNVGTSKITEEEAKKIGDEYLINLGLENFDATYYLTLDNMITINYAATKDDVLLYPDLIKVKIAKDTGEVCSVECTGYIFNHHERENLVPTISEAKAKESIDESLKIENVRFAVIPTVSKNEVLTYEFKCKVEDKTFLIYINANTGKEENVLLLLETKGGILTI